MKKEIYEWPIGNDNGHRNTGDVYEWPIGPRNYSVSNISKEHHNMSDDRIEQQNIAVCKAILTIALSIITSVLTVLAATGQLGK